ncbi:hypothetical protein MHYP_G00041540 [Metynnis hypsauchen]
MLRGKLVSASAELADAHAEPARFFPGCSSAELPLKEPSPAALRRPTAGGVCVVSGFCACLSVCQGSAGGREGSDFSGLVNPLVLYARRKAPVSCSFNSLNWKSPTARLSRPHWGQIPGTSRRSSE